MKHVLRISASGPISCLYTDLIELGKLGHLSVSRATEIVFNSVTQRWDTLDAPTGKTLFSHHSRQQCLRWEHENLQPGSAPAPATVQNTNLPTPIQS